MGDHSVGYDLIFCFIRYMALDVNTPYLWGASWYRNEDLFCCHVWLSGWDYARSLGGSPLFGGEGRGFIRCVYAPGI